MFVTMDIVAFYDCSPQNSNKFQRPPLNPIISLADYNYACSFVNAALNLHRARSSSSAFISFCSASNSASLRLKNVIASSFLRFIPEGVKI